MKLARFRASSAEHALVVPRAAGAGRAAQMTPARRASLLGRVRRMRAGSRFMCVWGGVLLDFVGAAR